MTNIESIAEQLFDGRRKAVKQGDIELSDFSENITYIEKSIIDDKLTDEYSFLYSTNSQLIFQTPESILKFARYGCEHQKFCGVKNNIKELDICLEHYETPAITQPKDYDRKEKLWVEFPYMSTLDSLDISDTKKTQLLTYVTDNLHSIDSIDSYKLHKSDIGYNEEEETVHILNYERVL